MSLTLWRILDRLAGAVSRARERAEERAWLARVRRRYPIGSRAFCTCQRCGGGRIWRVHSYDVEMRELRVLDSTADPGFVNTPWPIPIINKVECSWLRADAPTVRPVIDRCQKCGAVIEAGWCDCPKLEGMVRP